MSGQGALKAYYLGRIDVAKGFINSTKGPLNALQRYRVLNCLLLGSDNRKGWPKRCKRIRRYYIAPGASHCSGGPCAASTDLLSALDAWVTSKTATGTLTVKKVGADGTTQPSRPLCQFPQYPKYVGPANNAAAAALASNSACAAS